MSILALGPNQLSINDRVLDTPQQFRPEMREKFRTTPVLDAVFDLRTGHLPGIEIDHEFEAHQQIPYFIDRAKRAAEQHAISYRDFKVGASAYVIDATNSRVGYFFGANFTPYKGAPKRCAEMEVLTKARQAGFDRVIALATFGPSEHGDVNSVATTTLHPCAECREILDTEPLVRDDTLIVTSNREGDVELLLKKDLVELHRLD